MKKLREELESRRSSEGGSELIIRYIRGTPTIVSRKDHPNTRDLNYFLINIFYQNVRGLLTKIPYLRNALFNVNYDVICLKETLLYSNIFYAELGFNNYNIYIEIIAF